ncbi:hypothetical protein QBC46DRAFT_81541 [Diplogelasinospora grovesii]|uniref:Uncharacterized protein n=1 Tax=Diplogelasinospora grovesii TaxID=303347 RepID=A0AAN6S6C2_9PEZI|nr:hypothetical protein QBC46DRAFT_81541 [Diplogelasinospora grovesii]
MFASSSNKKEKKKDKQRLYVALYPSGVIGSEEKRYHWGFLTGPKLENQPMIPGMRYHVRNSANGQWIYEERPLVDVQASGTLLGRFLIAKVEDEERLVQIFRENPVVQGDDNWRCRHWVAEALRRINEDGTAVGTSVLDWDKIQAWAREYIGKKTADGRYANGTPVGTPRPTWDMLENKELRP